MPANDIHQYPRKLPDWDKEHFKEFLHFNFPSPQPSPAGEGALSCAGSQAGAWEPAQRGIAANDTNILQIQFTKAVQSMS